MASERSKSLGTCNSQVELSMLASGMAKQHESYQDALQELIDNSLSSVIKSESYFENPENQINIIIKLERTADSLRTTVADNGPGIGTDALQEEIFKTGNKVESDGILNNVGWGLKASLAWFEETLRSQSLDNNDIWFNLITKEDDADVKIVTGPVTGDLPVKIGTSDDWKRGTKIGNHESFRSSSGTRIHVSCSWTRFAEDVWPSAVYLETKAQALREYLGVRYRRILDAHPDNSIHIDYIDNTNEETESLEVIPIHPQYVPADADPPEDKSKDTFSLEVSNDTTFEVEYERGTLDYESMTTMIAEEDSSLVTPGGRFRTRYRPSQSRQGVDIYANGRILMTSVFTSLFDLTRNNQYNYFGGTIRIVPKDSDTEVPTDNKKTRIDTNSELWQCLREKLTKKRYLPSGKDYDQNQSPQSEPADRKKTVTAGKLEDDLLSPDSSEVKSLEAANMEDYVYDEIIRGDSRYLEKYLERVMSENLCGKIDLAITSPPYFDLKDYDVETSSQIGQGDSYQQYLLDLETVLKQVYNVVSDDGSLWVIVNNFQTNQQVVDLPGDIINLCQSLSVQEHCPNCSTDEITVPLTKGESATSRSCVNCEFQSDSHSTAWNLRDIIVWDKNHALPYVKNGQFRNVFEHILCFTKSTETEFQTDEVRITNPNEFKNWWVEYPERYNPRGMVPRNIWDFMSPSQGAFGQFDALDHPAPLPPGLVSRIVELASNKGDIVFDPFAGSGMVPATAEALNRVGIGIEPNAKFCERYPELKSEVSASIEDTNAKTNQSDQDTLVEMIMSLRMVKQAKEVLRLYGKSQEGVGIGNLEIHSVFQLCRRFDSHTNSDFSHVGSDLLYVVENAAQQQRIRDLEHSFADILSEAPLSQYGITTSVKVLSNSEIHEHVRKLSDSKPLTLTTYRDGKFHDSDKDIKFESWMQQAVKNSEWQQKSRNDRFPPILSNIDISVQNPRHMSEPFSFDNHVKVKINQSNNIHCSGNEDQS
ncbi:DNA methyltransferase [Haloquadratum walsbyi]|uniref:site-specific DNA-methyltransferase (cytosine-N(4)-specific) n=1 Tax=Haloquadratum walsbyi (strain DSM 16790 / HBSQ001) TaxID=362976 RepID=Q18IG8_HALWD|nr:DNA methyltransferase [Haloquadratum walsbyi]CAJ52204.1 ATP-binding domain protein protein / site-specific DNA-methyltransferase [Haloquadratum walsbyi DSM 16790]